MNRPKMKNVLSVEEAKLPEAAARGASDTKAHSHSHKQPTNQPHARARTHALPATPHTYATTPVHLPAYTYSSSLVCTQGAVWHVNRT